MLKKLSQIQKIIALLAILGLFSGLMAWQFLMKARQLTVQYGEELAQAVQHFREVEFELETRLNPDLILSVATETYLPTFLELNQSGMCEGCDRFWVTSSMEIKQIRVIEYSPDVGRIRVEVIETGYRVNSKSYERITPHDVVRSDTATYVFRRQGSNSPWLLDDIQGYEPSNNINPNTVTLDDFLLFDWDEIKLGE